MIFITVGTQLHFDRLISAVDKFYKNSNEEVFAQVGPSKQIFKNIEFTDFISSSQAEDLFRQADLIIAHAGMGSILTALKYQKPILVVPRMASLGEHRNEHQLATAEWVRDLPGVTVADDEIMALELLKNKDIFINGNSITPYAEKRLTDYLHKFIINV